MCRWIALDAEQSEEETTLPDTFGARSTLTVGRLDHDIFRLDRLEDDFGVSRRPYSIKVLLENLLRHEGASQDRSPRTPHCRAALPRVLVDQSVPS
jgi:hypothetical protein